MPGLPDAIRLATALHAGRADKAGLPQILHPLAVLRLLADEPEETRTAGVLHDVVEDTPTTLDDLRRLGYPEGVVSAIDAVTRRPGEEYRDFVLRAKAHPVGRRVKAADVRHNLERCRNGGPAFASLARRYEAARAALEG